MRLIIALLLILLPGHINAQAHPSQPTRTDIGTGRLRTNWRKLDAGPFSILAPPGWEFHQLQGVDSYVGEFVGDGLKLTFDFGQFSSSFEQAKEPAYVIARESIGGFKGKIVSPKTAGHGITGVYFDNVGRSNKLSVFGQDLAPTQQELVLRMFETIHIGGAMPRYVVHPPAKNQQ